MSVQAQVEEFHRAFNIPVGNSQHPAGILTTRAELRMSLVTEEANEVKEAASGMLSELAQELADLVYVCYGWAVELGVNLDAVIAEVHRANMSKLGDDGQPIMRDDGKVLKGPNFRPANVHAAIWKAAR